MKMNEILATIRSLASSQGFYGRLLNRLMEVKNDDPDTYEQVRKEWESKKFRDPVDFVMYIEG